MAIRVRTFVYRVFAGIALAVGLAWAADYAVLARKVAREAGAFGDVEVRRSYAVHLRNNRVEQDMGKPALEECVYSLFPHYDESPCWYLARHATRSEELDGRPWHFWAQ